MELSAAFLHTTAEGVGNIDGPAERRPHRMESGRERVDQWQLARFTPVLPQGGGVLGVPGKPRPQAKPVRTEWTWPHETLLGNAKVLRTMVLQVTSEARKDQRFVSGESDLWSVGKSTAAH
jgi:hypothetical protein